jgi:hypothetical protein
MKKKFQISTILLNKIQIESKRKIGPTTHLYGIRSPRLGKTVVAAFPIWSG